MRRTRQLAKDGDTRVKQWFAFFPVSVHYSYYNTILQHSPASKVETRWLEKVVVLQKYREDPASSFLNGSWHNVKFIDSGMEL